MKALLVNIDLMVRVIVPDNATDEQIIQAATEKALDEINADDSTISENISEWMEDEECPYEDETVQDCNNCKHVDLMYDQEPCDSCTEYQKWEAAV